MRFVSISSGTLVAFFFFFASADAAPLSAKEHARNAAQKHFTQCSKCVFFALPTNHSLVKRHDLFYVSTTDRVPPPACSIAVAKNGRTLLLDFERIDDWNALMKEERPLLSNDAVAEEYVRAFLELAYGRSVYIPTLSDRDLTRLRKGNAQISNTKLTIDRTQKNLNLTAFARSVSGMLQVWNLTVTLNGELLNSALREY